MFKSLWRLIQNHYTLAVILVVACLLRLITILCLDTIPISDFLSYYTLANNFKNGIGLSFVDSQVVGVVGPTSAPIGLPVTLGILFKISPLSPLLTGKLFNLILGLLTILIIYATSLKIFAKKAAMYSALIYCLYPAQVLFTNLICTEVLFTFLSCWIFYLLITSDFSSRRDAIFVGILAGLSSYVRPTNVMVFGLSFFVLLFRRFSLRDMLVISSMILIMTLLLLVPNGIRNKRLFGEFRFLNIEGGLQLWCGNNPMITTGRWKLAPLPEMYALGSDERNQLTEMYSAWYSKTSQKEFSEYSLIQRDNLFRDYALEYIKTHMSESLLLTPLKFATLYFYEVPYGNFQTWSSSNYDEGIEKTRHIHLKKMVKEKTLLLFERTAQEYYRGILVLMIICLAYCLRSPKNFIFSLKSAPMVIVMVSTIPFLITHGNERFHFPVVPLFVIYSGAAIAVLEAFPVTAFLTVRWQRSAYLGIALGVLLIFSEICGFVAYTYFSSIPHLPWPLCNKSNHVNLYIFFLAYYLILVCVFIRKGNVAGLYIAALLFFSLWITYSVVSLVYGKTDYAFGCLFLYFPHRHRLIYQALFYMEAAISFVVIANDKKKWVSDAA